MPRKGQKQDPEVQEKITARVKEAWSDPERRERMSEKRRGHTVSEETRAKLSAKAKGKTFPPEQIEKMRASATKRWQDPIYRAKVMAAINTPQAKAKLDTPERRARLSREKKAYWASLDPEVKAERISNWQVKGSAAGKQSLIEKLMEEALIRANVPFVAHHIIKPYVTDFFLSQWKACLECDGAYWHASRAGFDAKRDAWLKENGYQVIRVGEAEIMIDVDAVLARVLCQLDQQKE